MRAGRRRRASGGSAAALIVAALLAGCGTTTKRDFVASADAICAAAIHDSRELVPPTSGQSGALADYLAKVVPIVASEYRQMSALKRPAESRRDAATLSAYLLALKQSTAGFRTLEAAARTGDRQGILSAEAALRVNPVTSLAASYGLRSCAAAGATVS